MPRKKRTPDPTSSDAPGADVESATVPEAPEEVVEAPVVDKVRESVKKSLKAQWDTPGRQL